FLERPLHRLERVLTLAVTAHPRLEETQSRIRPTRRDADRVDRLGARRAFRRGRVQRLRQTLAPLLQHRLGGVANRQGRRTLFNPFADPCHAADSRETQTSLAEDPAIRFDWPILATRIGQYETPSRLL